MENLSLTIGWLYPKLMSTYADIGNIICFKQRCLWRGLKCEILKLDLNFDQKDLEICDLIFMGGAQDKQQQIVSSDLFSKKSILSRLIDNMIPGLYICGAYQFLGKYYKTSEGEIIKGLGIFDLFTQSEKTDKRLTGNIVTEYEKNLIIGFENHSGRTYLGKNLRPFGQVIKGFGNNSKDKTEGVIYKNSIGSYLHGPLLPKNPFICDLLLQKALDVKYNQLIKLPELNNSLEQKARTAIAKRLRITI